MPAPDAALLAEYQREPRKIRRYVSRDLARAYPVPPRPPRHDAVPRQVNARRPIPKRYHGIMSALGGAVPRSGQARINAKRNQRNVFWAAFEVDRLLIAAG
ncbi:hypothetical protein ABIA32_002706 [Streptacidiphilus sp. MAP12-20]|uniref:hypothetical protein n=1 Tax=Streptacidiphilus sp. MAP12-20 TaxID=3156299 RepID=UPI003518F993